MKIRNRVFSLLLAVGLVFSSIIPVSANVNYDQPVINSSDSLNVESYKKLDVESYKDWITSKAKMRDYETQTFLSEFNNLTQDEQELFVSYINDSDLMLNVLQSISNDKVHTKLENGNIVISNSETFENEKTTIATMAATQNRIGTASRSVTILGLKVFEYSAEIRYSHNGTSITKIPYGNIRISRNFYPFVSFSWSNKKTYGVGTRVAHHINNCTWSFVHEKLGLTVGTHQIEITGSTSNKTTFSIK